jgi:hypothetical protein
MGRRSDRNHLLDWRDKACSSVLVDAHTIYKAEQQVAACELCLPNEAEVLFDTILDCITGFDPSATNYILAEQAKCPRCQMPLQIGSWRWNELAAEEGRVAFVVPGTLVVWKSPN